MADSTSTVRGFLHPGALTRTRAVVVVFLSYLSVWLFMRFSLHQVEVINGYDDMRDEQMSDIFAVVLVALFIRALWLIYRRPGLVRT